MSGERVLINSGHSVGGGSRVRGRDTAVFLFLQFLVLFVFFFVFVFFLFLFFFFFFFLFLFLFLLLFFFVLGGLALEFLFWVFVWLRRLVGIGKGEVTGRPGSPSGRLRFQTSDVLCCWLRHRLTKGVVSPLPRPGLYLFATS